MVSMFPLCIFYRIVVDVRVTVQTLRILRIRYNGVGLVPPVKIRLIKS